MCGAQAAAQTVTLPIGTSVPLATVAPLSSKASVKGDMVSLITASDVIADGEVAIPKGTPATGQVIDARTKGAMGMSGRLVVRPLYLRVGDTIVRLAGSASNIASVSGGAVVGIAVLSPGFTGRSAVIPAGAMVNSIVEKTVTFEIAKDRVGRTAQ
jgi:hypothetical protein